MATKSRQNLLKNRAVILDRIRRLDKCIDDIATSGTASASLSAGGGSQSYTHADLDKLEKLRGQYVSRVTAIDQALSALGDGTGIRHVVTIRCGGIF